MSIFSKTQSVRIFIAITLIAGAFTSSINGIAETAAKKPLRFLVVVPGKPDDAQCLEPKTPCLVPTSDKGVTVTSYAANSVNGHPKSVALTFDDAQSKEIAQMMNSHTGKRIALILDGKVIQAPVVRTGINDGHKVEVSASSSEDAASLKAALGVSK